MDLIEKSLIGLHDEKIAIIAVYSNIFAVVAIKRLRCLPLLEQKSKNFLSGPGEL